VGPEHPSVKNRSITKFKRPEPEGPHGFAALRLNCGDISSKRLFAVIIFIQFHEIAEGHRESDLFGHVKRIKTQSIL
jgi:hypothetical protein